MEQQHRQKDNMTPRHIFSFVFINESDLAVEYITFWSYKIFWKQVDNWYADESNTLTSSLSGAKPFRSVYLPAPEKN